MKPLVERLEKQYEGTIEFRRLNVDSDPEGIRIANQVGAQYVPTFLFVDKDGVVTNTLVGEQTSDSLKRMIDTLK